MLYRRMFLSVVAIAAIGIFQGTESTVKAAEKNEKDIVSTAVAAGSFKTLAAALKAADLIETLQSKGPFTVFAPTDEAFAKLPAGTVESLLKPENKKKLIAVLTYHVVAGKVTAAEVVKLDAATTVNGKKVKIKVKGDKVHVNGATVVATDIGASNGIIHVIDSVLLPPAAKEKVSHATSTKTQYVTHVCPTTGRVSYTVAK
ncbi:MAG: fasciclin domain-containing protein [Pirellulales bacterium]